jgi:hypothetical protein
MIALHVGYAITAPLTGTRRQRIAHEPSPVRQGLNSPAQCTILETVTMRDG